MNNLKPCHIIVWDEKLQLPTLRAIPLAPHQIRDGFQLHTEWVAPWVIFEDEQEAASMFVAIFEEVAA